MKYIAPDWQQILFENGITDFESAQIKANIFIEEPNMRRGGWSGVCRVRYNEHDTSAPKYFYLKIQEEHIYKSLRHPIKGQLTFYREFNNLMNLKRNKVNIAKPIFYADKVFSGKRMAVLIIEDLMDYEPLDILKNKWQTQKLTFSQKNSLLKRLARAVKELHELGIKHGCLYPKHVFIKLDETEMVQSVAFIDYEKARKWPYFLGKTKRDLRLLYRGFSDFSRIDKIRFYKYYLNKSRLSAYDLRLLQSISKHIKQKGR